MAKLTQGFVKRIECEKGKSKQEFYDDSINGFILDVKSSGRKTYYLRIINKDKKRKYIKIDDAKILPLLDDLATLNRTQKLSNSELKLVIEGRLCQEVNIVKSLELQQCS
ncbi:hypothetical protein ACKGJI_08810 [Sulfurospirillum sp. 1307]